MAADALADLIRTNQPCVVLTGAGVSTESGIPDFRSPGGLWAQFDPLEYGSIDTFRADPEKVWRFYGERYRMLAAAEPNDAHRALAELEALGFVRAVITQNIDLLHARAGSRDVLEVHGSIRSATCPRCRATEPLEAVLELLARDTAPHCPRCWSVLKPDVVFFGEMLRADSIARAYELAAEARLLLVVGSTLEVYPVAALPLETIGAGGRLAIVNLGTTAHDNRATVKVGGSAGTILRDVVAQLTA